MNDIEKAWQRVCMWIGCTPKEEIDTHRDYKTIKQALEKQSNNGWILVAERLPNRETGCLVWQKIDGHYKYNIWHYVTDFPSSVIAWQPLPSTYKEVEDED